MALAEIVILRTQRLTFRLAAALVTGMAGVAILMIRSTEFGNLGSLWKLGGAPIYTSRAVALIIGALSWSVASALSRKLTLPASKVMSSGAQMLAGGIWLTMIAAVRGEFRRFNFLHVSNAAWLALLYLVFLGSIVAFTAYVWLLHRESPTKVGTYAYVNPVVAVLLGYWLGGETLGVRTVMGGLFVLASVIMITTARAKIPAAALAPEDVK
jgi:drug/metabolite transporter (DMT)-like permease